MVLTDSENPVGGTSLPKQQSGIAKGQYESRAGAVPLQIDMI